MKKLILAAMAAATLSSGVALARPTLPTAKPVAFTTNCTTPGDALGGLQITASGTTLTLRESTMEGKTVVYRTAITANDVLAMRNGLPMTIPVFTPKANMFGGAVSPAHLLTLTAKPRGGQRSGFLARQNVVFYLNCQGPF